jgi:hypothetical protein
METSVADSHHGIMMMCERILRIGKLGRCGALAPCRPAAESAGKASGPARRRGQLRPVAEAAFEIANLRLGLAVEPLLIGLCAGRATEPHAPIAVNDKAEFASAMVAPHRHERRVDALGVGLR